MTKTARWALGVSVFFVLVCLAVLWETRDIPPGTFEPLGSAPVPQGTALLVLALSVVIGLSAWRSRGEDPPIDPSERPHVVDAAATAILTVAYVAALQARLLDFAPMTTLYLFATIGFLTRFRLRALIVAAIVSAAMGWGAAFIFTRFFVVDLPGL
ncbi:tripartite tricarboxylate transporter TctB family protein [Acuticoccus sp. M5D2P5]|uniref:tripartite tricarboxylate transporter TctB family protein n=1 Tax=Acuticoccus kalidii TaxID=2910977 RepID=UPI001F4801BB|nr:tripartite tricarboxylate transporter TctB family protein [Acuticoccus kalidii]MCF3936679.1 tripartite tricarboxylate transporter TctB family protein [Acuticoccus kalidii]